MRRYLFPFDEDQITKEEYDLVIVGSGIAGLFAAIEADKTSKVLVVVKDQISESNSSLAQGGVAGLLNEEDSLKDYVEDTLRAGGYHNDPEAVRVMLSESADCLKQVIEYGVDFDREPGGQFSFTKEGGHSCRRILHVKDQTGQAITKALISQLRKSENIEIREDTFCADLITENGDCQGVLLKTKDAPLTAVMADAVIIACGGLGQIYRDTTNSRTATGDGIAMAFRAGSEIRDMEFIQFHPTGFYHPESEQTFLISEAVRGEGAVLRDHRKTAFMKTYHPMADLAPRDVTAIAIFKEMKAHNLEYVYLDISHKDADYITKRFPNIYRHCLEAGIDMTTEMIPVTPVQHYLMGGIVVDSCSQTTIKGLYACGEASCTGVHGANRLASNSLLEGLVFARRAVKAIQSEAIKKSYDKNIKASFETRECSALEDVETLRKKIKQNNTKHVFMIRTPEGLAEAARTIKEIEDRLNKGCPETIREAETINMATVSRLVIDAAQKRPQSLGSHQIEKENSYDQ